MTKASISSNASDAKMCRKARQIALALGIDTTDVNVKSARSICLKGITSSNNLTLKLCKLAYGRPVIDMKAVFKGDVMRYDWKIDGLGKLSLITRPGAAGNVKLDFVNKA